jgi:hypothetical protein
MSNGNRQLKKLVYLSSLLAGKRDIDGFLLADRHKDKNLNYGFSKIFKIVLTPLSTEHDWKVNK